MPSRIPLNTFAIAFGTAGLGGAWSTAARVLDWPPLIGAAAWIVVAIVFVWLIVAHVVRGAHSSESLASQLRHPAQGPLAALVPVVGMLLGAELYQSVPLAGRILYLVSLAASALFAAWILGFWMRGNLTVDAIHGGYFLPTVAAGLIAATAAAGVGMTDLALGAFAVGILFWIIMFVAIFARLALRPALPGPLVPTLAIFLAPPAVAGVAWFAIKGEVSDTIALGLAGLTVLTLLSQFALIPLYRRAGFSLGFWSFTFPLAATIRLGMSWLALGHPAGWQAGVVALLALITAVIVAVAIASLRLLQPTPAKAEQQLVTADNAAAL